MCVPREKKREMFHAMLRIRKVQERIESLYLRDGMKTPVHLCIGQEAVAVGVCGALRKDDYISSNHRGHGHYLAKGGNLNKLIAELHGKKGGCSKGYGGSMHLIDVSVGHVGSSAIVGGGIPIGAGLALASRLKKTGQASAVFFGDGASEEGVLYESVNFAILKKLPVVFVLENNEWSVCAHISARQAGENIFHFAPPERLFTRKVDGNDVLEVHGACLEAVERARNGLGPSFIECKTYRIPGHAGCESQDFKGYRSQDDIEAWKKKCPVAKYREIFLEEGVLELEAIDCMEKEIEREIDEAFQYAAESPLPGEEDLFNGLKTNVHARDYFNDEEGAGRCISYTEAVREGLKQALELDPRVFVMGQGLNDNSLFGVTLGLRDEFGDERVIETPLSEAGLTGMAVGAALGGLRPVYFHNRPDFLLLAMDQLVNHASKWHYMFGGSVSVPLVVWACIGRGWGSAAQHSQALQGIFSHIPGLRVIMPSTCHDAKGLMLSAIQDNNPVIILEHRFNFKLSGTVPEKAYAIPIGKGVIRKSGKDVTVVAISHLVTEALQAAEELAELGVDVEVIDPRALRPLDEELILNSVRKTGRLVIADSGWKTCGVTAEISAMAAEKAFSSLKAPIQRVAGPDLPTPAGYTLENAYYKGKREIKEAVLQAVSYKG